MICVNIVNKYKYDELISKHCCHCWSRLGKKMEDGCNNGGWVGGWVQEWWMGAIMVGGWMGARMVDGCKNGGCVCV